jgi:hypothetical protein
MTGMFDQRMLACMGVLMGQDFGAMGEEDDDDVIPDLEDTTTTTNASKSEPKPAEPEPEPEPEEDPEAAALKVRQQRFTKRMSTH